MIRPNITHMQQSALTALEEFRDDGVGEVVAAIPYFLGPWEIAARDAHAFVEKNEATHALLIAPHEKVTDDFRAYVGSFTNAIIATATPEQVAGSNTSQRYDYVVAEHITIPAIRHRIAPQFLLRLTTDASEAQGPSGLVLPTYRDMEGQKLYWSEYDSIRLYREMHLAKGDKVMSEDFYRIATRKEAPWADRILKAFGTLPQLREAAAMHHMYAEQSGLQGPETLNVWTADDSTRLYIQCVEENGGRQPTRKEFYQWFKGLNVGRQKPTFEEFLAPFKDTHGPRNAFGVLQQQSGFRPSRALPGTSKKPRHVIDVPPEVYDED